jgi:hypothetical protein
MPAKITLPNVITAEQQQTLRAAIIASASEQFRGLLDTHFAGIVKATEDAFVAERANSEPVASVSFKLKFQTLNTKPKVKVSIGHTSSRKDESEAEIDLEQFKIDLAEGGK